MKKAKWVASALVVVLAAVAFMLFTTDRSTATHERNALICYNCHTMHYSEEGAVPARATAGGPFASLLIDYKDNLPAINVICLKCHDDRAGDSSGAPTVYSVNNLDLTYYPGGDFNLVSAGGELGHFKKSGANMIVDDSPDPAPGGSAGANNPDSNELRCWSCHDPHNSSSGASDFRLLRKRPKDGTGTDEYSAADITVVASAGTFVTEAGTDHSVFVSGISEWCGACHSNPGGGTGFHGDALGDLDVGDGTNWIRHPTDHLLDGTQGTEYDNGGDDDWHIPLQDDDADWSTFTADHVAAGGGDSVMCLSCHRSHVGRAPGGVATYYDDGLRFDTSVGMDSDTECNKCHDK